MSDDVVSDMLARAQLPLTPEELERLQRNHPVVEEWRAALRFEAARYSEPAAIFPAGGTAPRSR